MDLVTGAIGSIGPKLLGLLKDEYKLQKGLRKQVKFLSDELESVHAALCKVAEVPWDQLDEQVKIWARQVREASYDMEDVLDTILVRVEGNGSPKKGKLKRAFSKGKARHGIAGAIEDIKTQLQEVADRRSRCKVDEIVSKPVEKTSTVDPRLGAMFKEVTQLIGINKSRDDIISMLQVDENIMKMISIVGVGGLGKTTLAKASYDKLQSSYECTAFVSVGRNPDFVKVFKDILFYLDKTKYKDIHNTGRGVDLLIRELQEFLQNKRYFIVIDDVWEVASWKTIKLALDQKSNASRVIITTRNQEVASEEEVYKLDPLSHDDSKRLFYIRLFGGESKCPANHPQEASKKILKKCGGVPLAIITMASLLVGKKREDWFDVCSSPGFYRGKGNQQVADDTEWILSLSYYDLPSYLRTCLLYLSMYPEDYEFEKDSLIWKWIAEGFVKKEKGSNLFERAEEYFNQLINRSMIQAVESEWTGIIKGCRVHDMVLDLIRGLSDKENFVTMSNDAEGTSSSGKKVRRLADHHNKMMRQTQQDDGMGMAQLRSLVVCRCDIKSGVLHPSFKLLRVLAFDRCSAFGEGWQGLEHLGNLIYLRYLGLRHISGVLELPEEIGKLKFLQTLDLEDSLVTVLPMAICELTKLVRLHGGFLTCAPDALFLTNLTSLEDLKIRFDNLNKKSQRQFVKNVGNLSQVRVLNISGRLEGVVQSLGNLHKLQDLRLMCPQFYGGEATTRVWDTMVLSRHLRHLELSDISFSRLPSCIKPDRLQHHYELSFRVHYLDAAGLRTLGRLPELRFLKLRTTFTMYFRATVANITEGDDFFPNLRCLDLYDCMVQLVVNEDSSSVSFSIWSGESDMVFVGSKVEDESSRSVAPPPVMPNLQRLRFDVPVRALYEDGNGGCDNLRLECLPSLHNVEVDILCFGATDDDVDKAEAKLRHATQFHPNGPVLKLKRLKKHEDSDEEFDADSDDLSAEEGEGELVSSSSDDEVADMESRGSPVTPSC
ncbi:unnamed protein product [Urochloa decumbens]|uniref:Uncharacterized protein n=1 Tax=Urochloa decumbens TaxID=240449 RepID=A0ABC9AZK5_9POAL